MNKICRLLFCLCFINMFVFEGFAFCQINNNDYYEGKMSGQNIAENDYSGTGYIFGGALTGFLFGLIGTGIGTGIVALGSPSPTPDLQEKIGNTSISYRMGFYDGYKEKTKSKNIVRFLTYGVIGSLCAGFAIASSNHN